MSLGNEDLYRSQRGGLAAIFWIGCAVALVSGIAFISVGLLFGEFGDDLLRPSEAVAGLALFSLYGLPLGMVVAWIAYRLGFIRYAGRLRTVGTARWVIALLLLIVPAGIAVAFVMMPVSLHLLTIFGLKVILVMALAAAAVSIGIFIDYRKTKAPVDR